MDEVVIRSARDEDSEKLIRMIDAVFAEHPGCILDVDAEMPELRAPATAAKTDSGRWWVAERGGQIVGSVAVVPEENGNIELKKLYVLQTARRSGLGAQLLALAESEARERRARAMVLWTDTRFREAHKLYAKLGFVRAPRTRLLNDISNSVEFRYSKELTP